MEGVSWPNCNSLIKEVGGGYGLLNWLAMHMKVTLVGDNHLPILRFANFGRGSFSKISNNSHVKHQKHMVSAEILSL